MKKLFLALSILAGISMPQKIHTIDLESIFKVTTLGMTSMGIAYTLRKTLLPRSTGDILQSFVHNQIYPTALLLGVGLASRYVLSEDFRLVGLFMGIAGVGSGSYIAKNQYWNSLRRQQDQELFESFQHQIISEEFAERAQILMQLQNLSNQLEELTNNLRIRNCLANQQLDLSENQAAPAV